LCKIDLKKSHNIIIAKSVLPVIAKYNISTNCVIINNIIFIVSPD
jgi:hypothetical protein